MQFLNPGGNQQQRSPELMGKTEIDSVIILNLGDRAACGRDIARLFTRSAQYYYRFANS